LPSSITSAFKSVNVRWRRRSETTRKPCGYTYKSPAKRGTGQLIACVFMDHPMDHPRRWHDWVRKCNLDGQQAKFKQRWQSITSILLHVHRGLPVSAIRSFYFIGFFSVCFNVTTCALY